MGLDFLPRTILVQVLGIPFEGYYYVPILHDFHQLDLALHDPLLLAHVLDPEEVLLVGVVEVGFVQASGQADQPDLLLVNGLV